MFQASLLFEEDPGWTVETFRGFLEPGETIACDVDDTGRLTGLQLQLASLPLVFAVRRTGEQLREETMDMRLMPPGASRGQLAYSFVFETLRPYELRLMQGPLYPDDWSPSGRLRTVLELLVHLGARGPYAIHLHLSGNCVKPIEQFLYEAGDVLTRRGLRPFAALLDFIAYGGSGELSSCHSYGLVHWTGLRDVDAACASASQADLEATMQAVKFACAKRVAENRELEAGEILAVPASFALGWALAPYRDDDDFTCWRVAPKDEIRWELVPSAPPPPLPTLEERWAAASWPHPDPQRIGREDYRALLLGRMRAAGYTVGDGRPFEPTASRYVRRASIERLCFADDDAELLMTCGLGRVPTPMGSPEHANVHVEVALASRACSPAAISFLEDMAVTFHFSEALGGVKPYDFVTRGDLGTPTAAGGILLPGNPIGMGAGADVQIFYAIPLSREEYAAIPRDDRATREAWTLALLDGPGGLATRVDHALPP